MDFISHGLYGGFGFGRKNRKIFWLAILIGMAPDLLSFGVHTVERVYRYWILGEPRAAFSRHLVPSYVQSLYNVTHSLVIFAVVVGVIWMIRKKPLWVLGGWGLHILVDIPTHSREFFPTPFLWPLSKFTINGTNWGSPIIFIPNLIILLSLYLIWYIRERNNKISTNQNDNSNKI